MNQQQPKNILCQHIKTISKDLIKQIISQQIIHHCHLHINHPLYYICLFCGHSLCISFQDERTCLHYHFHQQNVHLFYLEVGNGSIWCAKCQNSIQNQIFQYSGNQENDSLLKLVRFQAFIKDAWKQLKPKLNLKQGCIAHKGLTNLGNTCYLNSVLQCLCASDSLQQLYSQYQIKQQQILTKKRIIPKEVQYFFDDIIMKRQSQIWNLVVSKKDKEKGQHKKKSKFIINSIKKPSLNIELRIFFDQMKLNDQSTFVPLKILNLLGDFNSKYHIREEQDADQLLTLMIDALNEGQRISFLRDKERYNTIQKILGNYKLTPIQNIFGFYLINQIQCNQCKELTVSSNLTYNLSLSLNSNPSKESTAIFHQQPTIALSYPQVLRYPQQAIINTFLSQFFGVQRLNKNNNYYQCLKCQSILAYRKYYMLNEPEILIVTLKRFNSAIQKKNGYKDFPQTMNLNGILLNDKRVDYELFGVIMHQGQTLSTGHYVCIIKMQDKWLLCSDQKVQNVSWQYVKTRQAYILFYEKKKQMHVGNK